MDLSNFQAPSTLANSPVQAPPTSISGFASRAKEFQCAKVVSALTHRLANSVG